MRDHCSFAVVPIPMRIPLTVLAVSALLFGLMWLLLPAPGPDQLREKPQLPWDIQVQADGTSSVLGVHLGRDTLADAVKTFGPLEGAALFDTKQGETSLEAYFGTVNFGPLRAKVVAKLALAADEIDALREQTKSPEPARSGAWRADLTSAALAAQQGRTLIGLTYIPTYGGLEPEFFEQRFGTPDEKTALDKDAELWRYPKRGVSIVLDPHGKEVLEYRLPELDTGQSATGELSAKSPESPDTDG